MKLLFIAALSLLTLDVRAEQDPPSESAIAVWRQVGLEAEKELRLTHYAAAVESGKRALLLAKGFGPSDRRLGSSHYLLGVIYREWGHCAESRSHYLSAVSIWRKLIEPEPARLFRALSGLISVLCECDDFGAAQKVYQTYESDLERGVTDEGDRAQLLSLRGTLARGRKDYKRSAVLFREAVDLLERTPGSSPLEAMVIRNSLSVALNRLERYAEALQEAHRAAVFFERLPRQASYVAALNNEACALASLRRGAESQQVFERALAVANELYGEDNHIVARIMLSYSRVLRENHETPAAGTWRKRGEDAYRRSLVREGQTVDVRELQSR